MPQIKRHEGKNQSKSRGKISNCADEQAFQKRTEVNLKSKPSYDKLSS